MKNRRLASLCWIAGICLILPASIAEEDDPVMSVARIEPEEDGLDVEQTSIAGDTLVSSGLDEWLGAATIIHLRDPNRLGFTTQEYFEDGEAITVVSGTEQCVITRRIGDEPSPAVEFASTPLETTATITIPDGYCGGCVVAYQRFIDYDRKSCSLQCSNCSCMECDIHPCDPDGPMVPFSECDSGYSYDCWVEMRERSRPRPQPLRWIYN